MDMFFKYKYRAFSVLIVQSLHYSLCNSYLIAWSKHKRTAEHLEKKCQLITEATQDWVSEWTNYLNSMKRLLKFNSIHDIQPTGKLNNTRVLFDIWNERKCKYSILKYFQ